MNRKIIGLVLCLFIFSSINVISVEEDKKEIQVNIFNESILIDANSNLGILKLNNGFLHGRDENSPDINETLTDALKPEEWRLYKANSYAIAERHNANITYGLSNHYAWNQGGFPEANPWENWTYYEQFILYNMQVYDAYFPDYPVQYYDIWAEPDHSYFWHGTYEQLLELFYRTYNVIKSYNPDVKVVGPSISWFRPGFPGVTGIIDFLVDLDTMYGVRLDAISWHENGGYTADTKPEDIPYRAQYLRSQIQANFPPDYQPELHVNEYLGGILHLSPGWNVGFFRYLEEANIDKAMRACWYTYSLDPYDYCSDCWYGLNGMFMSDGQTPQRVYWIQYTHSQMEGHIKLDVSETNENTNAIAIRDDSSNQIKLLVGRYFKNSPNDVSIHIINYPYNQKNVFVKIESVPNDPTFYDSPPQMIPMPDGPLFISNNLESVIDGSIDLTINDFEDGDAFIITIYPEFNRITNLTANWNFISIPFNQTINITNLTVRYNGEIEYTWNEASANGLISPYLFNWNRTSQSYTFSNILIPGNGYWLFSYDNCELYLENSMILKDSYISNLSQRWNIMSIPNDHNINKSIILVNNIAWDDAVTAGIISDYVFGWNRVTQSYNFADTFMPGYAYWMYAYQPCTLKRVI